MGDSFLQFLNITYFTRKPAFSRYIFYGYFGRLSFQNALMIEIFYLTSMSSGFSKEEYEILQSALLGQSLQINRWRNQRRVCQLCGMRSDGFRQTYGLSVDIDE